MDQAHINYSGKVQGVGFRFTVQRYAQDLDLVGWVKNLSNGSVEMLVEGRRERIDQLCQNIEEHFNGNIDQKAIQFTPSKNQFEDFKITY